MVRVSLPKITPITVICDKSGTWTDAAKPRQSRTCGKGEHQGLRAYRRRLPAHSRIEWCNQEYEFDGVPLRA
jgi:hypothetical protein